MIHHAEFREAGNHFVGTILTEGRAATMRREVFAPGSVIWPPDGIAITDGHRGAVLASAVPERLANGEIEVRTLATDAIRQAIQSGRRFMSIEFRALSERTTQSGIREVLTGYVDVGALVDDPEYDCTRAEVREALKSRTSEIWRLAV